MYFAVRRFEVGSWARGRGKRGDCRGEGKYGKVPEGTEAGGGVENDRAGTVALASSHASLVSAMSKTDGQTSAGLDS